MNPWGWFQMWVNRSYAARDLTESESLTREASRRRAQRHHLHCRRIHNDRWAEATLAAEWEATTFQGSTQNSSSTFHTLWHFEEWNTSKWPRLQTHFLHSFRQPLGAASVTHSATPAAAKSKTGGEDSLEHNVPKTGGSDLANGAFAAERCGAVGVGARCRSRWMNKLNLHPDEP